MTGMFLSDNVAAAHPAVMDALVAHNVGSCVPYGEDGLSARVRERLCEIFEAEVDILLVSTGTAANAIGLSAVAPGYGLVLCHSDAHIRVDECGAPEMYTGGCKLQGFVGEGGKLRVEELERFVSLWRRDVHRTPAAVVSISQQSEYGRVYSCAEVAELASFARAEGLVLHMDGARFANAVVSLGCTPAEASWRAGVDILSFGASKNGALAAEAIIVFGADGARRLRLEYMRKRGGHLLSKMRILAAQFEGYLADDLWLELARHANGMAGVLAAGLQRVGGVAGVSLLYPCEGNEIFARIPGALRAHLRARGHRFLDWEDAGADAVRLVTSWSTSRAEVDGILADMAAFVRAGTGAAGTGAAGTGAADTGARL